MIQELNKIESAMQQAVDGSRSCAKAFYESFLNGPLYVPERFQEHPLSNSPEYPDDFLNILGIKGGSRTYVPVFSRPSLIQEWCGSAFKYRSITGTELLKLLPETWWIVFNPGQEIEKEISDWEIENLKQGPESIDEIVSEIYSDTTPETINVEPLKGSDYPALKLALKDLAQNLKGLKKIYLLKEVSKDVNDYSNYTVLIGLEVDKIEYAEDLKQKVRPVAEQCQIGNDPFRLLAAVNPEDSLLFGIFRGTEPIYQKTGYKSFFSRLFS